MSNLMWFSLSFAMAAAIGMYLLQGSWYFLASGGAVLQLRRDQPVSCVDGFLAVAKSG